MLACLPYEAYLSLDAIVRTVFRMLVSHRGLLEWNPSRHVDRERDQETTTSARADLNASFRTMWFAPGKGLVKLVFRHADHSVSTVERLK